MSRPQGARLLTNLESRQYMPVIKQSQLAHLKTTLNDEKFFLLAIKKLSSWKIHVTSGCDLGKRIVLGSRMVLFSLTAVGSPSLYAELMYAAWPDYVCLKSSSLPPSKAFGMAYSSPWLICFNHNYAQVLRHKKRARNVLFSEFPASTSEILLINSKQFSVVQTGRENK